MILRPRQRDFVTRCVAALRLHGNTLGVAPTGAGKTIILSFIAREFRGSGVVLQHLVTLVDQNRDKFLQCYPEARIGIVNADVKKPVDGPDGWTFAMMQTLVRHPELLRAWDLIIIDEAHHATTESYATIIDGVRALNPSVMVLGLTATPNRADGTGLRAVFNNIGDQITLAELIASGHLVPPRSYVRTLPGVREEIEKLEEERVRRHQQDLDMDAASTFMDTTSHNDRVVEEWEKLAPGRQTIAFSCNIPHAKALANTWSERGHIASVIHSKMGDGERRDIIEGFRAGAIRVLTNCNVLTEGFDHQPVACIALCRPSSSKPVALQMIGRGLRTVDPTLHPDVTKTDCTLLDFGTTLELLGDIEQEPNLDGFKRKVDEHGNQVEDDLLACKQCPQCKSYMPHFVMDCTFCGYSWPMAEDPDAEPLVPEGIKDFAMREIELIDASPFRWETLFGKVSMAQGFNAWTVALFFENDWYCVGGSRFKPARLLARGPVRFLALAAGDDWMRENETDGSAKKSRRWLDQQMTEKQAARLNITNRLAHLNINRYMASCLLVWKYDEQVIKRIVLDAFKASKADKARAA